MKYSKIFNITKSLNPDIVNRLKQIPDSYIFSKDHNKPMRHPGAIFNISLIKIFKTISRMINKLNIYEENRDEDILADILDLQKILYGDICSLYDESFLILISLCSPSEIDAKFAEEWLKQNGYNHGGHFKSSTYEVIQFFQEIHNRLKHNNQKINIVEAECNHGVIFGHYIEGLIGKEAIGPDPEIHDQYEGAFTCFSFNYILRKIALTCYVIADNLEKTIKLYLKEKYKFKFPKKEYIIHDIIIEEVLLELSSMKYLFFPDEYSKKFAKYIFNGKEFKISYPHTDKIYTISNLKMKTRFSADGYSDTFAPPYFVFKRM